MDTDEHTFNLLARAVPALGRWTIGVHDGTLDVCSIPAVASTIINRRLDLMEMFGYSVGFNRDLGDFEFPDEVCLEPNINRNNIVWYKNRVEHRNDQPAVTGVADVYTTPDRCWHTHIWAYNGNKHRWHGPATMRSDGQFEYYLYGDENHISGGPSSMGSDGLFAWRENGRLHNNNGGPSIMNDTGYMCWFEYDQFHREGGPARILPDGRLEFWLDDSYVSSL